MKLGVITLHRVNNYGSVLQTYATQKVFGNMGYTVEFVYGYNYVSDDYVNLMYRQMCKHNTDIVL